MKNRSLQDWGVIAEIVAAIAVVLSLLFVAFTIKQNTAALQVAAWERILDRAEQSGQMLAESADLARIVFVGESDPDALTAEEYFRFRHFAGMRFGAWESVYGHYELGRIDLRTWELWHAYYLEILDSPGYRRVWLEVRQGYDPYFSEILQSTYLAKDPPIETQPE